MKDVTRRDFLRFGTAASVAVAVNSPLLGQLLALAGPDSDFFTIAVISDTQNYVDGTHPQPFNKNFFLDQTRYLAKNVRDLKLSFVVHVGDMVEHGDGSAINYPANYGVAQNIEWLNAVEAMDILDATGVPFGVCIGNHDYDNYGTACEIPLASTPSCWKKYFGPESNYFRGKPWYGGASDKAGYTSSGNGPEKWGYHPPKGTPCNYGLSSYQFFSGGGRKFLHLCLELEAGDAALRWAQEVLNSHREYATIVTTHSYLSPPRWDDNNPPLAHPAWRNRAHWLVGSPGGYNDADSLWTKLIAPNDQIFLLLCGHSYDWARRVETPSGEVAGVSKGENIRIDKNKAGHPVYQVLTDYQGNTTLGSRGGDGWYRFMQFDMESRHIHFYTLNAYKTMKSGPKTLAGKAVIYSDGTSDFNQPKGFSDFSLPMPVQVLESAREKQAYTAFA